MNPEQEQAELEELKQDMIKEVGPANNEFKKQQEDEEKESKEFANCTGGDFERAFRMICYFTKLQEKMSKIMNKAGKDKSQGGMLGGPMGPMLMKAFSGK